MNHLFGLFVDQQKQCIPEHNYRCLVELNFKALLPNIQLVQHSPMHCPYVKLKGMPINMLIKISNLNDYTSIQFYYIILNSYKLPSYFSPNINLNILN